MKNKLTVLTFSLLIALAIFGCKNSKGQKQDSEKKEVIEERAQENKIAKILCFQNEYPFQDNPSKKDVQQLRLSLDDKIVTGTYNWIPAEKDQRKGTLTGTISENVVDAQYTFMQEGIETTHTLKISLKDNKAIIQGEKSELGLDAAIEKVDCVNLVSN